MKTFEKPLTQGEEAEYIRLLQQGNEQEAQQARQILVERNLRLVAHIAKKYQGMDEELALVLPGYTPHPPFPWLSQCSPPPASA